MTPLAARLTFLVAVVVLGALVSWSLNVSIIWGLLIAAVAILVNGLFATLEDDMPGGFNNPDGTETPAYVERVGRIVRWSGALLALVAGAGVVIATINGAISLVPGLLFVLTSVVLGVGLVLRRRSVQWAGLALLGVLFALALWSRGVGVAGA